MLQINEIHAAEYEEHPQVVVSAPGRFHLIGENTWFFRDKALSMAIDVPVYVAAHLCGGGLMLGAWFMATDYVSSPITKSGQIIFGICCGILTGLFRCFGANAEGVSFAIILSNLLVPMIEKITIPRAFGQVKEKKEGK